LTGFASTVFDGSISTGTPGGATSYIGLINPINTQQARLTSSSATGSLSENFKVWFDTNHIDVSQIATFNVNELRFAFQLQKYFERGARGGYRYIEQLRARFGVHPRDSRLQRPEYIGGTRSHLFFSEVLQTSSSDGVTPQANMAGHGITSPAGFAGRYRVEEYGCIIGVLRVLPRPAYQQGINRQWQVSVVEDLYSPEFANLGEQAIRVSEIYATGVKINDDDTFGYQGRWDEFRYIPDSVMSDMRDVFSHWHLGRKFDTRPYLNASFVECDGQTQSMKRIFAVQNVQGLIVNFGNVVSAARPLPVISEPGLIDHH